MRMSTPLLVIWLPAVATAGDVPGTRPAGPVSVPAPRTGYVGISRQVEVGQNSADALPAGGLATYSEHHTPMAWYAEAAGRTLFVYGGIVETVEPGTGPPEAETGAGEPEPPADNAAPEPASGVRPAVMAAWFDHHTKQVSRPAVVLERSSADPRGNAALTLDADGHLWVFAPGQSEQERGVVLRSTRPNDVSEFREIHRSRFFSPQPWFLPSHGFLLFHHRKPDGGPLYLSTSPDGSRWSEPRVLVDIGGSHRHVSWRHGSRIGVAFNVFLPQGDLRVPTNLYYIESHDGGRTWTTAAREPLELPLEDIDSSALVYNYKDTVFRIHVKDLSFDALGNPSILYLASVAAADGRQSGRCYWNTARRTGRGWEVTGNLITSDNINDSGCLHWEEGHTWRFIAPTVAGPFPGAPGGEVMSWTTGDYGRSWRRQPLTWESRLNHSYVRRPVNAHPDFYALWSDGHPHEHVPARLYFANQAGEVFLLPAEMKDEFEFPQPVKLKEEEEEDDDATPPNAASH